MSAFAKIQRTRNNEPQRPPEFIKAARELWAVGLSTSQIGKRLGVSKNVIVGVSHRNPGFPPRPSPLKEVLVTPELVEKIRQLVASEMPQREIAAQCGICCLKLRQIAKDHGVKLLNNKETKNLPQNRAAMSEIAIRTWADPEIRERRLAGLRRRWAT